MKGIAKLEWSSIQDLLDKALLEPLVPVPEALSLEDFVRRYYERDRARIAAASSRAALVPAHTGLFSMRVYCSTHSCRDVTGAPPMGGCMERKRVTGDQNSVKRCAGMPRRS